MDRPVNYCASCDSLPLDMRSPAFNKIDSKMVTRRLPSRNVQGKSVRATFVEIVAPEARAAVDFYQNVFDWGSHALEGGGVPFHLAGHIGERALAGIMPMAMRPQSLAYFETDNIAERAQRIRKFGGTVVRQGKQKGVGEFGQFKDPSGNAFGLLDNARQSQKIAGKNK